MSFNSPAGRSQIELASKTSSGLHTINSNVVAGIHMPLPSLQEQVEIIRVMDSIESQRSNEVDTKESLVSLNSALMSVLLTGEVRVTPADATA